MTGGKVTAPVWGGPLDGHVLTELAPACRVAVPSEQPYTAGGDLLPTVDAGSFDTYELMPWAKGSWMQYRWVRADIAERIRKGWADA